MLRIAEAIRPLPAKEPGEVKKEGRAVQALLPRPALAGIGASTPANAEFLLNALPCPSPGLLRTMIRIAEAIRPLPATRGEV